MFVFSGCEIDLVIVEILVNFIGVLWMVMIINGLILVLILCLCEGDEVIICVINCLFVVILIYWYGILLFY